MPSDTETPVAAEAASAPAPDAAEGLAERALAALEPQVEVFHSAVAAAEEEIRNYVTHRRGAKEFRAEQALIELGPFAVGRVDPGRFGVLLGDADELTPEAAGVMDRAEEILSEFALGEDIHRAAVEHGGDLRDVVKETLDHVGQVFGASRAVELARSGLFDPDRHNHFLGHLAFRKWNRAERQLAPPLVVEVEPGDLLTAGLGEFLDGLVKVVLVVRGTTTPAPLARLITPGTYVVQTADPEELAGLAQAPHPGVALLFDEERDEQARFVHDPEAGGAPWQRLDIRHMPEDPEVGRGRRAPVWMEELAHLRMLAEKPAGAVAATNGVQAAVEAGAEAEAQPVDRLAAWLLSQTDLEDAQED